MKSTSAIHPAIAENMEDSQKCTPHISISESHNTSVSAILKNIIAVRSVSVIFMLRTEAITIGVASTSRLGGPHIVKDEMQVEHHLSIT